MGSITIGGKKFELIRDTENVVRFKENNLIHKLKIHYDIKPTDMLKLCELGAITLMDLLDYYTGIGYTLSGVQELFFFDKLKFEKYEEPDKLHATKKDEHK